MKLNALKRALKLTTIVLSMLLLNSSAIFSQNISKVKVVGDSLIVMTPSQLKQTNLIFTEHKYLLKKDSLQSAQIVYLDSLTKNLMKVDSLRNVQVKDCRVIIDNQNDLISKLNSKVEKQKHKIKVRNKVMIAFGAAVALLGGGYALMR